MSKKVYWRGSQLSQRGTIGVRTEELVRIKYKAGGIVSVSPFVAQVAVSRGEAEYTTAPKSVLLKKP